MYGTRKNQSEHSRTLLLVEKEAERYTVYSIARFRNVGLYFATLKALGLPDLVIKVEYKPLPNSLRGLYILFTIKENNNTVLPVCKKVENILGGKVTSIISKFHDNNFDDIKKEEDRRNANAVGK